MRPATYESEIETRILVDYFNGYDDKLVNTVFCLLDPSGKRLIRAGRSPSSIYAGATELVTAMRGFASAYAPKDQPRSLPSIGNLRLALNLAACDSMPLVVGVYGSKASAGPGATEELRRQLEARLAELSWSPGFRGQAQYLMLAEGGEEHGQIMELLGASKPAEIQLLMPDAFGQSAELLAQGRATDPQLEEVFAKRLGELEVRAKNARSHIAEGKSKDLVWESATGGGR